MNSYHSTIEWYFPDKWSNPRCKTVLVSELLFDFENTLDHIMNFCGLTYKKSIKSLIPYHSAMLSLQQHLTQDQLCSKIVESTLNHTVLSWSSLPLPSEAWIQWQLRNHGFEIRCNGLDTFPTNSLHLKELLYSV